MNEKTPQSFCFIDLPLELLNQIGPSAPQGLLGNFSCRLANASQSGVESRPERMFLNLRLLPRRIAENHVKACTIAQEDLGEGNREVEGRQLTQYIVGSASEWSKRCSTTKLFVK